MRIYRRILRAIAASYWPSPSTRSNWTTCSKPSRHPRGKVNFMKRWLPIALLYCLPLLADKYDGPRPPKPDIPYLMHADSLLPTESVEAQQEDRKGDVAYTIPGANSPVRTPLSSPAFLFLTDQIQAD